MKQKLKIFIEGMDLKNPGKVFIGLLLIVSGVAMLFYPDLGPFIVKLIAAVAGFSGILGIDLTGMIGVTLDAPTIILSGFGIFNIGLAHKALKGWAHLRTVMNGPPPQVSLDDLRKGQTP
jgi:hypothetical protein